MEMHSQSQQSLLREKFDVVLIAAMFIVFAGIYIAIGFPDEMREMVGGLFIAFLTVAGIRPRIPNPSPPIKAEHLSAEYVETASTQTGDINAVEIKSKEKPKNENSNS